MLSDNELRALLERYEDDPAVCGELLRMEALRDPAAFVHLAQAAIASLPVSLGLRFITALAVSAGIVPSLLDVYARSRLDAFNLAKKISQIEPRFDLNLAEYIAGSSAPSEETPILNLLDILDTISEGDVLAPTILPLLKHPNPKIRSKAALFVGSRTRNASPAADRSQEYDPRVRANILESLYGLNSDVAFHLFRSHASDDNNRVAGNAALGLYQLGEASSIPVICNLAKHHDPRFRNTGAWVMGRTGDPRFAPIFSELVNDPDELVRAQAFKGQQELKKARRIASSRPRVGVTLRRLQIHGALSNVIATVLDATGQPVRGIVPTAFAIKTGDPARFVRDFSVEEYDCRSSLNIAFVMCLPVDNQPAVIQRFKNAVDECAPLRRSKDRWAVLKISGKTATRMSSAKVRGAGEGRAHAPHGISVEYSSVPSRIADMLNQPAVRLSEDDRQEAQTLLKQLGRVDIGTSKAHIVFLASGRPRLLEYFRPETGDPAVIVHVIADSADWDTPEIRQTVARSGGSFTVCAGDDMRDTCRVLNSSLLHHYKLGSPELSHSVEVDVHSPSGEGSSAQRLSPLPERVAV